MKDIAKTKIYYFQNRNNQNIGRLMTFPDEADEETILKNIKKGIESDLKTFEELIANIDKTKADKERKEKEKNKLQIAKKSYQECDLMKIEAKDNKITGKLITTVPELLN